jgi:hypothetical protein
MSKYQGDYSYKYDITFSENSIAQLHTEWNPVIINTQSSYSFHFKTLQFLQDCQQNDPRPYDVMAIITSIGLLTKSALTSGNSTEPDQKCDVTVLDMSTNKECTISLYGQQAQLAVTSFHGNPVVAFCPVSITSSIEDKVNHFNLIGHAVKSPAGPVADALLTWWLSGSVGDSYNPQLPVFQLPSVQHTDNVADNGVVFIDNNDTSDLKCFTLISELDMNKKDWIICGRVFFKSDITNTNSEGTSSPQFCITILDCSGVDILARFDSEQVVQQYYHTLEVNKIYSFSQATLAMSNSRNKYGCASKFDIAIDSVKAVVCPIPDDQIGNSHHAFNLLSLKELSNQTNRDVKADIVVIVKNVGDIITKTSASNQLYCDLLVTDESGCELTVTVWNNNAFDAHNKYCGNPVIAFYPVRIKSYQKDKLSVIGQVFISPEMPRSNALTEWWLQQQSIDPAINNA